MFGIGMPELIVILVVALIVLGPRRMPDAARGLGRALGELRRATSGITEELHNAQVVLDEETENIEEAISDRAHAPVEGTGARAKDSGSAAKSEAAADKTRGKTGDN